ncbi:hypothetical protein ACHAPT_008088 [Fusarium lateritium]
MSTIAETVPTTESMTIKGIISPRAPFRSVFDDKILAAASEQYKSQPIKCVNEVLPQHPIWYTGQSGIQKLFAGLRLPNVQTKDDGRARYYVSSTKESNMSRHTLEWAEEKGNHIMVVSRQEARVCRKNNKAKVVHALPTNQGRGMRHEINQRMKEVQRGIHRGRHLGRAFYVVKVKDTPEEAIWCLVRKVPQKFRTFKSPLTKTEKAREKWRVEQEGYAEKQRYKYKHLTPDSSQSP